MRKLREVLRLKHERGLSHRAIAQACAIGLGTVTLYLRRTAQCGLGWPLPTELDDAALEARLFRRPAPVRNRARPDCAYIHRELKRNGVTLQLLWEEYAQVHQSGYRYTQFCEIYRQWARRLRPSMRQVHRAGEKSFIDFSGKRPSLVDRRTGELRSVELFVAVLGASSLTYVEATATQQLADWVNAHIHMVEYFGGATTLRGRHHAVGSRPAEERHRPGSATRPELGPLNRAIRVLLDELNDRPMKKLGVSRRALYEQLDRPALRPLPTARYVLAHWKLCRVDYHIEVERHVYSVPYQLVREQVEVRSLVSHSLRAKPARVAAGRGLVANGS